MQKPPSDATERFTNTVENYIRYRPGYPKEAIDWLAKNTGLLPGSLVADVGSGTGIFAKALLDHGYRVIGVEPNAAMRQASETLLAQNSNFSAIDAPAEATTLPEASVDLITAATAFHWFDQAKAKKEFVRITKPPHFCALLWNIRVMETPFMQAHEALLVEHGINYRQVAAEHVDHEQILNFYHPNPVDVVVFPHAQYFDEEGYIGRILSTSYSPKPGMPGFDAMMAEAKKNFARYSANGKVEFLYHCKIYLGKLG